MEIPLARGLRGIKLVVSDDHAGLKAARSATLSGITWQRCQRDTIRDAMTDASKVSMRTDVSQDLKRVFDADDDQEATRRLRQMTALYRKTALVLANWLEENVPQALTALGSPPPHRRRLRTTNRLEQLNREIKLRSRVAILFPNEASLLRLVSAVLSEISNEWETQRTFLTMETR